MRHFLYKYLLLTMLLVSAKGYCGTIKGSVSDKPTGEPVMGAAIMLTNTKFITTSGLDGSFILKDIPTGTYDIEIKYPGSETYRQHLTINDTQTITVTSELAYSTKSLTIVEVKAKFKTGTDEESRNIEKTSDNLINSISARQIELLPDITIANVLQRVSGVTVQRNANGDARYVIIRGMDKRYNYTLVNGVKIPSPDDKARFVPMDIFPAELVDRVEVIKTLTPNMEGDAVGGVMNLIMKNAPDHEVLTASAATGYNQTLFDRSFESAPKSGFNQKDPIELHGSNYLATNSDFQKRTGDIRNTHAPANGLFSLTAGKRFLKDNKLGVIFSGSYQNTFKGSNSIFFLPSIQPDVNNTPAITNLQLRKYSTQDTRTGLHSKIDYKFNSKHSISLYALHLQLDELQTRDIVDTTVQISRTGAGTGPVDYTKRAAFRRQRIDNLTLQGNDQLLSDLNLDYSLVYSLARMDVPDMTELHTSANAYLDSNKQSTTTPQVFNSYKHSWERTRDEDRSAYLNFTYTPTIFGEHVEVKAGGMYRNKNRSNYYNDYTQSNSNTFVFNSIYDLNNTNSYVSVPGGDVNNLLNYTINEEIYAYYGQAKIEFNKLQILGGVRVENTHQKYAMNVDPDIYAGQNGELKYTDVLPSVHFKYTLSKKENIRLSYFESIQRPGFFEITPYSFTGEYYTEVGNPYLNHSVAQNFDVRYEWFPKGIDQLLVGGFFKNINNPIELALDGIAGKASKGELIPQNVPDKPANVYGAEIVATKYFHYFGISANYTFTQSTVTTTKLSNVRDSSNNIVHLIVSETRPLQGQSAHVANLALIYKNPEIGFDAHLSWVYTGRRIAYLSIYQGLDYWQRSTSFFDFSCEKKIFKHLSVYAKVNNLLNTASILELMKSKDAVTGGVYQLPYQTLKSNILVEKDYYGRNYLIGIRYKLDQKKK